MTDYEALLPEFEAQLLQLATELGLCEAQRELLSYRQLSQALKTNGLKK